MRAFNWWAVGGMSDKIDKDSKEWKEYQEFLRAKEDANFKEFKKLQQKKKDERNGGIMLAVIAVIAVVYFTSGGDKDQLAAEPADAPPVAATRDGGGTGSVKPPPSMLHSLLNPTSYAGKASEPTPAAPHVPTVEPGAVYKLTAESAPKLFKTWGKKGIERINAELGRVARLSSERSSCDSVYQTGYSFDLSTPKKTIATFADCRNEERFYLYEGESDLQSVKDGLNIIMSNRRIYYDACENLIKKKVTIPQTFDRGWLTDIILGTQGGTIEMPFSAKNAYGLELKYLGYCLFDWTGKVQFQGIKER